MKLFPLKYIFVICLFFSIAFIARAQETNESNSLAQYRYAELGNPMVIPIMRTMQFPGSEIVIEQVLPEGENYYRYITSFYSEGYKIYALMTIPKDVAPRQGYPAIVFAHGYIPPKEYQTDKTYYEYINILASHGYIVMSPDFRGHGESEGEARGAYFSPAYTIDFLNAISSLRSYKGVDRGNIGVWGHSMGGHVVIRALAVTDTISAAVIWSGVVGSYKEIIDDWKSPDEWELTAKDGTITPAVFASQYGTLVEDPSFWDSISPTSYVGNTPIQLHHGRLDTIVPPHFSETFAQGRQNTELYIYDRGTHMFENAILDEAGHNTLFFFNTYMK